MFSGGIDKQHSAVMGQTLPKSALIFSKDFSMKSDIRMNRHLLLIFDILVRTLRGLQFSFAVFDLFKKKQV